MSVTPEWWYLTEKKRTGAEYVAANGGKIADFDENPLKFEFNDGDSGNVRFLLSNVTKPLGSVSNVHDTGNRVVFDGEGSSVELKSSGKRILLRRQHGVSFMDV